MGCFNVSCSVSNLSINAGEKAVLIPLTKNRYVDKLPLTSNLIYTNALYEPLMLPIKGTYDDYGSLENIEEDANTSYLSKITGMSIQEILRTIIEGECIEVENVPGYDSFILGGMFVHRDIYDELTSNVIQGYSEKIGPSSESNLHEKVHPEFLKLWGFKYKMKTKQNSMSDRTAQLWKKEKYHIKWNEYSVEFGNEKESYYDVKRFMKAWKEKTGEELSFDKIKNLSPFKLNLLNFINKSKEKDEDFQNIYDNASEDEKKLLMSLNKISEYELSHYTVNRDWQSFNALYNQVYLNPVENDEILTAMEDLRKLNTMMYACNVIFMPSTNGFQHGCTDATKLLLKATKKALKNRGRD